MKQNVAGISRIIYHGSNLEKRLDQFKKLEPIISRILTRIYKGLLSDDTSSYRALQKIEKLEFKKGGFATLSPHTALEYHYNKFRYTAPFSYQPNTYDWVFSISQEQYTKIEIELPVLLCLSNNLVPTQIHDFLISFDQRKNEVFQITIPKALREFLIVEYDTLHGQPEVYYPEIYENTNHVTQKFLEFSPELYEAGRGILSYFGTYLKEQYGDQKAKVTIEQDDTNKTLRMTVISETGDKEVIEKAYEEFKLIVSKQALPEHFTDDNKLILKLQAQLDIMEVNVKHEMRARMIAEGRTEELMLLLGKSLDQKSDTSINIHQETTNRTEARAKAEATAKSKATAEAHQNLSLAIGGVAELKELMPAGSAEAQELEQLEQGLESIAEEQDTKKVQRSPAMSKFRRMMEEIASGDSTLAKTIKAAKEGHKIFKDVAGKYNKIAQWCGLPVVPDVFL